MRAASIILALTMAMSVAAQTVSLDSCRTMALQNNKQLMMSRQRIQTAQYQQQQAFAAYLPSIDFAGGYIYNQKKISIFDSDQLLPTKTFDLQSQSYQFNLVKNPLTGEPIKDPATGQYIPETVALIPKDAMTYDIHNVFFGAITLTQPIYMGGKIVAMNKITQFAEQAARELHDNEAANVIYAVDAAYWQVVSLKAKHRLAVGYVNLLDSLDRNVGYLVEEGMATNSDKLSVDVKLNSAKVDLVKVENGLALSRMALAQVCGLPVTTVMILDDEDADTPAIAPATPEPYDMQQVYDRRHDLQALRMAIAVAGEQKRVAKAEMLPTVALMGAYTFSNPNMFNGFSKSFSGAFSVGVAVSVPIWHWGGHYYKYKAAESEEITKRLSLDDAEQMVSLQVSQAAFRADESVKTYTMTLGNLDKANENLEHAQLAFKEGMATADNVMEAQTAWLKANAECIDAMIDVQMCNTYLSKVLGNLR